MGKPYSEDLRRNVVHAIESGHTYEETAELCDVSISSVSRFLTRWRSTLGYRELARKGERANSDNPVRVGLASETGFPHSGTVDFVNNQIDAPTGTINVRATVPNPDGVFVPGLYARVQLEGRAEYMALLIDDKAIMTDQDRKYVYVLGPEDKVKRKDIVLGSVHDGLRVVQSGLDANDKVIVAGFQKIFAPDTKVKPNLVAMSTGPSPNP